MHVQVSGGFEFGIEIAVSVVGRIVVTLKKRAVVSFERFGEFVEILYELP
jgi:hypothetical protein